MYADNINDLENAISEICNISIKFNNFVQRFENNLNRKEQWIKLYRLDILYRSHETNNYAEASIRIIKDILLSRTKALLMLVRIILLDVCLIMLTIGIQNPIDYTVNCALKWNML